MSIIPFTNFTVIDLSNVQQPYVNSCTEFGYFNGTNLGIIPKDRWYSLPAVLNTNNGIANVDASGVRILNPGLYSINLSLFPTTTQDGSCNISFNFGTRYLFNDPSTNIVNSFGGVRSTGMFTYNPSNNPYSPGILSWLADGYNSANSTISNFIKNPITNELSYNYSNSGYSAGALYSGICTTEIKFIVDSSASIFFNVSNNTTTGGVTMGNCYFTLELISTKFLNTTSLNIWNFSIINSLPTQAWKAITSSSDGQFFAAVSSGNKIALSSDSGINWTTSTNNSPSLSWTGISSSYDGQYLVAVTGGAIWRSTDYGLTWTTPAGLPSTNTGWTSVASSSSGAIFAIASSTVGIWKSTDYGNNWIATDASSSLNWVYIASDQTGTNLFAIVPGNGVWRSLNSGSWFKCFTSASTLRQISSSSDGLKLVVSTDGVSILTSIDSGSTWVAKNSNVTYVWAIRLSGDGSKIVVGGYSSQIGFSTNFGNTWSLITSISPTPSWWKAFALSSNGSILIGGGDTGNGSDKLWRGVYT